MDCFGDFCLSCDRQTNGTPFCSQACRLAELDHSSPSPPVSPSDSYSESISPRSTQPARSGFYLPPAFDFSLHRTAPLPLSKQPASLSSTRSSTNPSTLQTTSTLSPSSSQTSLSSVKTTQSHHTKISRQAENDLKEYARSFDQPLYYFNHFVALRSSMEERTAAAHRLIGGRDWRDPAANTFYDCRLYRHLL